MSVDGAQYRVDQALKNSGWNKTNGWSAGLDSISKDHFSASAGVRVWESKDSRWTAGVGASMTQNFGPHGNTNFAYSGGLTFKF